MVNALVHVLEGLPARELAICRLVCREWNEEILKFWSQRLLRIGEESEKEAAALIEVRENEFQAWFVASGSRLQIPLRPFPWPYFACIASSEGLFFCIGGPRFSDLPSDLPEEVNTDIRPVALEGDTEDIQDLDLEASPDDEEAGRAEEFDTHYEDAKATEVEATRDDETYEESDAEDEFDDDSETEVEHDEEEPPSVHMNNSLYVGNPTTRVWKEIPWPVSARFGRRPFNWTRVELRVNPLDKSIFKLVILAGDTPFDLMKKGFNVARRAFVYDSTTGEWKAWRNSEKVRVSLDHLENLMNGSPDRFVFSACMQTGALEVYHIQNDIQTWFRYVVDVKRVTSFYYPRVFRYDGRWILVSYLVGWGGRYGVWELVSDGSTGLPRWKTVSRVPLVRLFGKEKMRQMKAFDLWLDFPTTLQGHVVTITPCTFPPVAFDLRTNKWHHMGLDATKNWGYRHITFKPTLEHAL